MRRVALALLITASTVARAQTPYPVPVPPEELPPSPPPAPPPDPRPTPVPLGPDNKPIEQQPQQPAPQQPQQPPQQPPQPQQPNQQQPQPPQQQPQPQPQPQPVPPPKLPDLKIEQKEKLEPNETLPTAADLTASLQIKKIVVEDNTKTTSDTVEVLAGIETGDSWNASMVDVVKTRLVSSGLFKDVEVYWTRVPEGVVVHILAKDKHSWVIAPAFYNQPTNVGGGIGFGENNLFGQNQKLLLYGQIATGDSFFIGAWVIPSIGGTRFYSQLDTYLKSGRNIEYTAPDSWLVEKNEIRPIRESRIHYLNFGVKLGIELWRGVKVDTRLRAASVSYQDVHATKEATAADFKSGTDLMNPPAPGMEGTDISNEWSFTIDRRANWYGVQEGRKYTVSYEHATPSLGSDFRYWLASFSAFRAYKVLDRHNLILKGAVNYGHNLPFQQEFQTGGTSMRGWLNNEFRGDFRTLANLEYSVPMFTIHGFSVRGLAFWDSAYTTFINTKDNEKNGVRDYLPKSEVRGLDGFKNSVGVGTRFYLRQIVLPLLGLDFGYGLEARDVQIYLAIGLTD